MPAATQTPLESPAVKRSKYLAALLEQQRQEPQQISSGLELGTRLLAQGLTQFGSNRADKAVETETTQRDDTARTALATALGGAGQPTPITPQGSSLAQGLAPEGPGNSLTPTQSPIAPIAPVGASPLPPATPAQPQAPMAAPAPMPADQPAPQQAQVPPALANRIRQIAETDLPTAQSMLNNYLNQQAQLSTLPPEIANDPTMAWLAATNPEEFTKAVSQQYSPQVIAQGGIQSIAGTGETIRNPMTREYGTQLVRDTPDGIQVLADRGPDYTEQAALRNADTARISAERPETVNTAPGGLTTVLDATGAPIRQIEGREDPAAVARREEAQMATQQSQTRALQVVGNTRAAVARAREQNGGLAAGVLSNIIPLNQWRANLAGTIETIQANLSFNELAAMRAASPTGGALGSIAVKELELLGATVASLNQNQSPEEFDRSLDVIDAAMARWQEAVQAAQTQSQSRAQTQSATPPLPPGFRLD